MTGFDHWLYPQVHYAFDTRVLTVALMQFIEENNTHWVSELHVDPIAWRMETGTGGGCRVTQRSSGDVSAYTGTLSEWAIETLLGLYKGRAAQEV